jgi:anaphase-promoting complex subunit 3
MAEQSIAILKPLVIYSLEHDMLDTAEFTAERLLAQLDTEIFNTESITNIKINTNPDRMKTNNNNLKSEKLNFKSNLTRGGSINGITETPTPHSLKNSNFNDTSDIHLDTDKESSNNSNKRKFSLNSDLNYSKLDAIHLYAHVLYRRKRYKTAYNVVSKYCGVHVGCSYVFAKCCKELQKEPEGIRALLMTMNLWENLENTKDILPDSIACHMLLAKLYSSVNDIPRATIHFSKILKLNPFIFEAFEKLCKLGVRVNVDSIYKNRNFNPMPNSNTNLNSNPNNQIIETEIEHDLDEIINNQQQLLNKSHTIIGANTNTSSKNPIFKTPITKIKQPIISTSSPDSSNSFITPMNKSINKSSLNNKNLNNSSKLISSKRNTSITSRLLHNNSLNNLNMNKGLDDEIRFLKKNSNDNVFKSSSSSSVLNNQSVFSNNSLNLFDIKEHPTDVFNFSDYLIKIYSKLAKGYLASTIFDCFKAIRIFDSLPENERNTPWVLSKLGRLHFEIVNYEEAENYFKKSREIDRAKIKDMEYYSTLLWHLHKEIDLSFLAHELFEIDSNSAVSWICIGNLFSFKKEPEDAIKCFNKAIEFNPNCAYAYTLQGHEYLATDAFENALNSFRHAIVLDKRHYNAFYGIGMVYLKLGDFRKAEFHFRKAVEINPVNVILICCIGMALEKLGKREASLKQYEFATKLQPLSMLALFKKAQVLFNMGRYDEALKDFEKLENLAPDEASVHFLLGKLYKHYGRKHDAIKQFTISLNLDPKGSHLIKEAMENLEDGMAE